MTTLCTTSPLFTDLYELTMAAGFHSHGMDTPATFSLFIRPSEHRNFFVAAGLEDALRELEKCHFSDSDLSFLRNTGLFPDSFIAYLNGFRFSGSVHALPDGTVFFGGEPIMEVTAPIIEAQIVETFLLNTIGFQILIASKAARCTHAAQGRGCVDFSLRRTQGRDAGMNVARSTYIAGFAATSNVLAGKTYGIPLSGTMAHSYVGAFDDELSAFAAYARVFPDNSVFLIDTYDTLAGAANAVKVALEMKKRGAALVGVRLDSGDMTDLSIKVRRILDSAGLGDVKIFASSGFDEYKIANVLSRGAKIDAFGVGTKMGVSADAPYVDVVYKMVRFGDRDVRKFSPGKVTLAGKKQVFRKTDNYGRYAEDVIGTRNERVDGAEPMLEKVMAEGKILSPPPTIDNIRARFIRNFSRLDDRYKALNKKADYPVKISERLAKRQLKSKLQAKNPGPEVPVFK